MRTDFETFATMRCHTNKRHVEYTFIYICRYVGRYMCICIAWNLSCTVSSYSNFYLPPYPHPHPQLPLSSPTHVLIGQLFQAYRLTLSPSPPPSLPPLLLSPSPILPLSSSLSPLSPSPLLPLSPSLPLFFFPTASLAAYLTYLYPL